MPSTTHDTARDTLPTRIAMSLCFTTPQRLDRFSSSPFLPSSVSGSKPYPQKLTALLRTQLAAKSSRMIAKMEFNSGATTVTEIPQLKVDPEIPPAPAVRPGDAADAPINIKKEAQDDVKVNLSTDAENPDMFDDVDGPEYVDLSYEGLAEINGVEHFVCESLSLNIGTRKTMINTERRLQDTADSDTDDWNSGC